MGRRLLAWDAPNLDMTLASLLDGRPTSRQRPDLAVLMDWFRARAEPGEDVEAAIFVNVREDVADKMAPWVLWLTTGPGYRVFCKPKIEVSDIDDDLVAFLTEAPPADLREVVLVSHDARAFLGVVEDLARVGVDVTVLGFAEYASQFVRSREVEFLDLGDIKTSQGGLFAELPPRVTLHNLPPQGRWFEPSSSSDSQRVPVAEQPEVD